MFISFEGLDGSGKTTQAKMLVEELNQRGFDALYIREPGTSKTAETIRNAILEIGPDEDPLVLAMLFSAARRNVAETVIKPALEKGQVVVCDRFFDSTYAIQGVLGGASLIELRRLTNIAIGPLSPDRTFYLAISPVLANARKNRGNSFDSLLEKAEQYRLAYRAVADPDRWIFVDANRDRESIHTDIIRYLDVYTRTR